MAAIASLHVPLRGRRWLTAPGWLKRLDKYPSVRRFIHYPGVTALVGLYLVACPVLVATIAASGEDQPSALVVSDRADARSALLLTFAVNLFYFSLVVAIAVFGLHRVAMWALKEAITDWRRRISNLGRGLSILVVFTALALLTAETWETMRRISTEHYLLLVGSILGLTGAFHLINSLHHLTEISRFNDWSEVRDAARSEQEPSRSDEDAASRSKQDRHLMLVEPVPGSTGAFRLTTYVQHSTKQAELDASSEVRAAPAPEAASSEHGRPAPSRNGNAAPDNAIEELLGCDELRDFATSGEAPKRRLDGLATINTVIVMMTYEIFFFIPATVIAVVVFLVLSHVTVPSPVAANWIYGDRASPTEIGELTRLPFLQQPWPRVALLLTAFSILTLAVDILSDPEKRKLFFGNSDMAVRRRLAVRLAYCEVLAHRKLPEQRYRRPF